MQSTVSYTLQAHKSSVRMHAPHERFQIVVKPFIKKMHIITTERYKKIFKFINHLIRFSQALDGNVYFINLIMLRTDIPKSSRKSQSGRKADGTQSLLSALIRDTICETQLNYSWLSICLIRRGKSITPTRC
jgi:hypothetical protein